MPKGIPVSPEIRAFAVEQAITALGDGVPAHTTALRVGVPSRTLYTWLQNDERAFQVRVEAILSGKRFAHARGPFGAELRPEQLAFRRKQALRRLAIYRQEHKIELRKPKPRKNRPPTVKAPEVAFTVFA